MNIRKMASAKYLGVLSKLMVRTLYIIKLLNKRVASIATDAILL